MNFDTTKVWESHKESLRSSRQLSESLELPPKRVLLNLYYRMVRIRLFEEKSARLFERRQIPSIHSSAGEEAISVGVCSLLNKTDYVTSHHRSLGHFLAKGGSMNRLMAEFYGRTTGCSGGLGGEMLLCEPSVGFLMSYCVVGGNIPVAVGAAIGSGLIKNERRVTVCFFGDAAAANAAFHEGLNIAAVFKAPVIFVCEHNYYNVNTPAVEYLPTMMVADKAHGYGIPGMVADGNDVIEVRDVASQALRRARVGEGPTLIEFRTSRIRKHKEQQADTRPPSVLEAAKMRDPIPRYREYLRRLGLFGERWEAGIRRKIHLEIKDAEKYAKGSPVPTRADMLSKVYA